MKRHRYQWFVGGLFILVALALGIAVFLTQRPEATRKVDKATVEQHYLTWKRRHLKGDSQLKYVQTTDKGPVQTLSEAQGYGMLIAVMAAKQGFGSRATFDQLTRYYLAHRISGNNPLMAWRQTQRQGQMTSHGQEKTSATDGDLDIAYALILADELWGDRKATLPYDQLAKRLIAAIHQREINPVTKLPRVGDWATSGATISLVRTSDLMTAYFRKFARYTHNVAWSATAQNSQKALSKLSTQHKTGLMADFVTVRGPNLVTGQVAPKQVASKYDAQYGFNACRVPWRVAFDYQLSHSEVSHDVTAKMLTFFKQQKQVAAGYTLSGQALETYSNAAFDAPIAYAAYALGDKQLSDRYARNLTRKLVDQGYYPATVQMVTLLASGAIGDQ